MSNILKLPDKKESQKTGYTTRLLGCKEVLNILGISKSKFYTLCERGQLAYVELNPGGKSCSYGIREEEVQRFIEENSVKNQIVRCSNPGCPEELKVNILKYDLSKCSSCRDGRLVPVK